MTHTRTMNPLLPVKNRTESFWLRERDARLTNYVSPGGLPSRADIVIIGSGISGALAAYHVFKQLEEHKRGKAGRGSHDNTTTVVMLEAAELCEGATARNGGHCKPLTYLGFRNEANKYGAEVVNAMYDFEASHLARYAQIVLEEDLDCDMHETRACDLFFEEDDAREAQRDFEARAKLFPESIQKADIRPINGVAELETFSGVKGGFWGCHYPAGHLWPYKFATQLIDKCIRQKGLKVFTATPALKVSSTSTGEHAITTSRGIITAKSVITTINAFTAGLLPRFQDKIVPVRGTACSIRPPPSHSLVAPSGRGPLRMSYGLRHNKGSMDYLISRQGRGRIVGQGDRSLILGGSKHIYTHNTSLWYNNIRDNEQMPGAREYFESYMKRRFVGWNGNDKQTKGNVETVWTGILGYSIDLLPFIGMMPDTPGLFVSAGFTGHGMVRIPACSEAIARIAVRHLGTVLSGEQVDELLAQHIPSPYLLSEQRLNRTENKILALMGRGKQQVAQARL